LRKCIDVRLPDNMLAHEKYVGQVLGFEAGPNKRTFCPQRTFEPLRAVRDRLATAAITWRCSPKERPANQASTWNASALYAFQRKYSTATLAWPGQANHLQSNAVHVWCNFARKCNCGCLSLQIGSVPRELMCLNSKLCRPGFKQLERGPPTIAGMEGSRTFASGCT
jgi:hypothetical protein